MIIRETGPKRYSELNKGVAGSGVASRSASWCRSVKGKLDDLLKIDLTGSPYDALGRRLVRDEEGNRG